jgi:hypothetical protein
MEELQEGGREIRKSHRALELLSVGMPPKGAGSWWMSGYYRTRKDDGGKVEGYVFFRDYECDKREVVPESEAFADDSLYVIDIDSRKPRMSNQSQQ